MNVVVLWLSLGNVAEGRFYSGIPQFHWEITVEVRNERSARHFPELEAKGAAAERFSLLFERFNGKGPSLHRTLTAADTLLV